MSETNVTQDQPEVPSGLGPRSRPSRGTREPSREATRPLAAGEYLGRNGVILRRGQPMVSDPYHIPEHLHEPGWDLQWNTVSVTNNTEVVRSQDVMMQANGWTPVPADRVGFKELFGQSGQNGGCIIVGGLRLDERPSSMTEAARAEEYKQATGQIRNQSDALRGGKADSRLLYGNAAAK
jgi:hypothetical protein